MIQPRNAVILAHARSGSTLLASLLDSHPDIHCTRWEPLNKNKPWTLPVSDRAMLNSIFAQQFYRVNMTKILYPHQTSDEVWATLSDCRASVVFLQRENLLKAAVSWALTSMDDCGRIRRDPHTENDSPELGKYYLNATGVILYAGIIASATDLALNMMGLWGLEYTPVTYNEIVCPDGVLNQETTDRLCGFLGVQPRKLSSRLRRTTPTSLASIISNWDQFKDQIADSWLEEFLQDELGDDECPQP